MDITTEGPIKATVDPSDFSISINSSKTWKGTIIVDPASAPAEEAWQKQS